MKKINLIWMLLFMLFGAVGSASAILPVINITNPLNDTAISGATFVIRVNLSNAGGAGLTNASWYYQSTINTTLQAINITATNSSENQTNWTLTWDTTTIQDSNVTLAVNLTYNNGTLSGSSTNPMMFGVIVNNTQSAVTLSTPSAGLRVTQTTSNRSLNFSATTNELYNNMTLRFNGRNYQMRSNANNNTWGATVDEIPKGSFRWYVTGSPIDGDIGELTPVNALANLEAGRELVIIGSGGFPITMEELEKQRQQNDDGGNLTTIIIVVIIALVAFNMSGKKK